MSQEPRKLKRSDMERMHLPEKLWRVTVGGIGDEAVRSNVSRYMDNFDLMKERAAGLFLSGESGVGKSAIAALIAKHARARGCSVHFITVHELKEAVRYRTKFDGEQMMIDRCRQVDVLILDDLCLEDLGGYGLPYHTLEELVATRGSRNRITLITTQLGVDELGDMAPVLETTQDCMVFFPVVGPNQKQQQQEELSGMIFGSDDS